MTTIDGFQRMSEETCKIVFSYDVADFEYAVTGQSANRLVRSCRNPSSMLVHILGCFVRLH